MGPPRRPFLRTAGVLCVATVAAGQFATQDVGVVRECFGIEQVAGCASGANATAAGSYFNEIASAEDCFEACYAQDDCNYVSFFVAGSVCYNLEGCDSVSFTDAYSGWRLFQRNDFGGACSTTESPHTGLRSYVGGGVQNVARAEVSSVGGGSDNIIEASAQGATIGGGQHNSMADPAVASTILGATESAVSSSYVTVVGGYNHTIDESGSNSAILAGHSHIVQAQYATVLGGARHSAAGAASTIGGGADNTVGGNYGVIGGGRNNLARGDYSVVAGGLSSFLTANYATTLGGFASKAQSRFAQVLGGSRNEVRGRFSAALGFQAQVTGKYSCSLGFSNGNACPVATRKSIGICADEVWFGDGGLDLVELANTKTAIGRRTLSVEDVNSAADKVKLFGLALLEKADEIDAKLSDLDMVL